jgi:flap endonuclease-1
LSDALQHVSELERLHETIGEPSQPRDIYRSPPEEEETSILDEALEQVVPEEAFRESKRQRSLTEEEGRIVQELLGGRPAPLAHEGEEAAETKEPLGRLDDLIQASPEVKATYQRALNMPTPSDHDACRELVMKMGVPVIEAKIPYEAEGLAASLAIAGLVDFVGSEDSDVIAYEVSLIIQHKTLV